MWRASVLLDYCYSQSLFLFLKTRRAYKLDWPFPPRFLQSFEQALLSVPIAIQLIISLILTINGRFHLYLFLPHLWYGRIGAHEWRLRERRLWKRLYVYHCMRCVTPHCILLRLLYHHHCPSFLVHRSKHLANNVFCLSQKHTALSLSPMRNIRHLQLAYYWNMDNCSADSWLPASNCPSRSLFVSHIIFHLVKLCFLFSWYSVSNNSHTHFENVIWSVNFLSRHWWW